MAADDAAMPPGRQKLNMPTQLPFEVQTGLLGKGRLAYLPTALKFADPGRAVIRPLRLIYAAFVASCVLELAVATWFAWFIWSNTGQLWVMLVGWGFMASWVAVGWILGRLWYFGKEVILDVGEGRIGARGRNVDPMLREGVSLRQVAALQLCSGTASDSQGSFRAFELNAVLSRPPGQRVNLAGRTNAQKLRQDAQRLAEFLDVPLLDDTA